MVNAAVDFLHYIKHNEEIASEKWKILTGDCTHLHPFKHNSDESADFFCYMTSPQIKEIIEFLEKYNELFCYLNISPSEEEYLQKMVFAIKDPDPRLNLEDFRENAQAIWKFIKFFEKKFFEKTKKFTCLESWKIGEALECFKSSCYYASSILMVSAIEARLHTLIKGINKKEYESHVRDAPLGKIISLRDSNNYNEPKFNKIKKIVGKLIPEKHIPLIRLVNQYRIFSAHPSDERMNDRNIAASIINLSFSFLIDKSLQIPQKLCNEKGQAPSF